MRLVRFIATIAVAFALGALCVGRGIVLPALDGEPELLDPNLAKAIARPLHLRLAEIALAANVVLAAVVTRWIGTRAATTLALVAVAASLVHRFLVVPALYTAWARVDLVAGRPLDPLRHADRLHGQEALLVATIVVLQCVLVLAASGDRTSAS